MKTQEQKNQISIADATISACQDINNVLANSNVKFAFRSHYANVETGVCGIEKLLETILRDNGSVFPRDAHNTELRPIVIAGSMSFKHIKSIVRNAFGPDRYPDSTLYVYLCIKAKNICKVQLTGNEDISHKTKPCAKYYLAQ